MKHTIELTKTVKGLEYTINMYLSIMFLVKIYLSRSDGYATRQLVYLLFTLFPNQACGYGSRFDEDGSSMFLSSSPDVNERTRLTASEAGNGSSSSPPGGTLRSPPRLLMMEDDGMGSSIGGIGGSLLRGAKGRMSNINNSMTSDFENIHRRQTTVRLLRSDSPESSC